MASDLTDRVVGCDSRRFMPPPKRVGRPRTTDLREVVNAIFYIATTGCQWTRQIKLGPLGHLLPYHNPVELAHRVAYLDHMAAGRYQLGVGISALPTDRALFGIEGDFGLNRRMTFESLEIMTKLWADGPSDFAGEFWSVGKPDSDLPGLGFHLTPYQDPHPPIAIAGLLLVPPIINSLGRRAISRSA
jgi:hypothetical protein